MKREDRDVIIYVFVIRYLSLYISYIFESASEAYLDSLPGVECRCRIDSVTAACWSLLIKCGNLAIYLFCWARRGRSPTAVTVVALPLGYGGTDSSSARSLTGKRSKI